MGFPRTETGKVFAAIAASGEAPDAIARSFLEGTLVTGGNICDHGRVGMDLVNGAFFDHFINPRNAGLIRDADGVGRYGDPVCGDFLADGGRRLISRAGGEFPRPACLRKAPGCV